MSDTQKAGAVNQLTEVIQREQSKWTFPLDMSAAEKFAASVVEAVLASRQPAAKNIEKAAEADPLPFSDWWISQGKFIDPDTEDVPWFDKRKDLCEAAYDAGQSSVKFARVYAAAPFLQEREGAVDVVAEAIKQAAEVAEFHNCPNAATSILAMLPAQQAAQPSSAEREQPVDGELVDAMCESALSVWPEYFADPPASDEKMYITGAMTAALRVAADGLLCDVTDQERKRHRELVGFNPHTTDVLLKDRRTRLTAPEQPCTEPAQDTVPRSVAIQLKEALEAKICMENRGSPPRKLDDALSWRENDEKAQAMAEAALEAARKKGL